MDQKTEDAEWGALANSAASKADREDKGAKRVEELEAARNERRQRGRRNEDEDGEEVRAPPKKAGSGWGVEDTAPSKPVPEAKRPGRRARAGRWDDDGGSDKAESKPRNRHFADGRDDDMVMVIPSLDDEPTEEDITLKVAEAPERYTREMQSLHELDAGIKDQLGTRFAAPSGEQVIDLSLLTKALASKAAVQEPDEHWEFETLLEQVAQEMTREREAEEEAKKLRRGIGAGGGAPKEKAIRDSKSGRKRGDK